MSSNTSTEIAALAELISVKTEEQYILYLNVAFIMLLVYDHVITFAQEVQTIWQTLWRLPKILFIFNRYITPPMLIFFVAVWDTPNLSKQFCDAFIQFSGWPVALAVVATELVMAIRVSALYRHQKTIIIFLTFSYIGHIAVGATMAALDVDLLSTSGSVETSRVSVTGCSWPSAPLFASGPWISIGIYEICIVALTAYKVFPSIGSHVVVGSPMLRLFARDSLVYFSFTFGLVTATIVLYGTNIIFKELLVTPIGVTVCITLSRMLMNMRMLSAQNGFNSRDTDIQLFNLAFRIGDVGHSQATILY